MLVLLAASVARAAQLESQRDVIVTATVNGPPPSTAATITSPQDNAHVSARVIVVSGTCTPDLFVEIIRNSVFAGQTLCDHDDSFSLSITLEKGANKLVARIKDGANQYGPDSSPVTVFYDAPSPSTGGAPASKPDTARRSNFMITTKSTLYGVPVDTKITISYRLLGGAPPYAVSVDWGDGSSDSVNVYSAVGEYQADHIYKKDGHFTVTITGSDKNQTKATIQTVVIVYSLATQKLIAQGVCQPITSCITSQSFLLHILNLYIWPALVAAFLLTTSFWLGEHFVYIEYRRKKQRTRAA